MRSSLPAVVSGALIAVGCGLVYLPAGLIVAGLLGFAALYVSAYLKARAG